MKKIRAKKRRNQTCKTRSTTEIEIVKPPHDFRDYRVVILPNKITALLISDFEDVDTEGQASAALCIGVGSFSDPPEIPGLAHFLEHMVFMGSQKYPMENFWDEYLANNGGESNAWTDSERTCFHFICNQKAFNKGLNIFAEFFKSPLFLQESVDREMNAIDSEWTSASVSNQDIMYHIISHEIARDDHPMKRFSYGNLLSLKKDPERKGINVYEKLRAFFDKMYSAHYMTLVVHAMDKLDEMERTIVKIFATIPNNEIPQPKYTKFPFEDKKFNKLFRVVPSNDVNSMEIFWALPPQMKHYSSRCVEFLQLILSYAGNGSILAYLRRRGLATDITADNDHTGFTYNESWSAVTISIRLTKLGIDQYEQILQTVFLYINLFKENLPRQVFEDQKHIQETRFIFNEQDSIDDYVEQLSENMQLFPFEHYLCGRTLYFEFNDKLINYCVNLLQPQKMLVILLSKDFANQPSLCEEPWTHAMYTIEEFHPDMIQRFNNLKANPELMMPMPNPYIPRHFSLVKYQEPKKLPVVVFEKEGCKIWHKDSDHESPNAFVFVNLISSVMKGSENFIMREIIVSLVLNELKEKLHDAKLAGYELSVETTKEGIVFIIEGFSNKIKLVTHHALMAFTELKPTIESFQMVVASLKQDYYNQLVKPVQLARDFIDSILEANSTSVLDRYKSIFNTTYEMLKSFIQNFYAQLVIEGLVTGNLEPKDAAEIGELTLTLVTSPLSERDFPQSQRLRLVQGDHRCFMSAINQMSSNSCVTQYFELGLSTIPNSCLNDLLEKMMEEPLFRILRSEKQLGYNVSCQSVTTDGVLGFLISVESQADKFSMIAINAQINKFIQEFTVLVEETQSSKVAKMVKMESENRTDDDGLYDESHRIWQEILKHTYLFERLSLERDALNEVSKRALIDWCMTFISSKKRKLTVIVEGHSKNRPDHVSTHPDDESTDPDDESTDSDDESTPPNAKFCVRCIETKFQTKEKSTDLPTPDLLQIRPDEKGCLVQLKNVGTKYITNINAFKSIMQPYSCHISRQSQET